VRLRGVPVEEWEGAPEPLWWGADEYEAVVDAERGVVLRLASRLGGEDFDALEVEEVYFDERFREDVFISRKPLPWSH
jgi:cytolysin (calcineurin-like family phosphatase)